MDSYVFQEDRRMARGPYRFLALGLIGVFGAAIVPQYLSVGPEVAVELPPPSFLPRAQAAPVDVPYADTLRAGETLSELLQRSQLDGEEARSLLAELTRVQNPRNVRPGLMIRYRKSTRTGEARGIETQLDADRTLTLKRAGDSWAAAVEEVPVERELVVLTGTVQTSLYRALMEADTHVPAAERPAIIDALADRIFAWKIDFSRDQRPGDTFRILYERMARPDGTARTARVLAVEFQIGERKHDAFLFAHGGTEDYYDSDGESLRRAFLRAPLQYRRISSAFSRSRFHPVLRTARPHNGIDYAAATGTPIHAVADGVVTRATFHSGYGNVVDLRHSRGYATRYAHMSRFAAGMRNGVRVKQGDVIGYVGSTGMSTGPHLHYEFHDNGRPIDPNSIRHLSGDPVPASQRAAFRAAVGTRLAAMDRPRTAPSLAAEIAEARGAAE
jgi:murein DD-endopeptidase MepM/ murein hydrolase activator NlpD